MVSPESNGDASTSTPTPFGPWRRHSVVLKGGHATRRHSPAPQLSVQSKTGAMDKGLDSLGHARQFPSVVRTVASTWTYASGSSEHNSPVKARKMSSHTTPISRIESR